MIITCILCPKDFVDNEYREQIALLNSALYSATTDFQYDKWASQSNAYLLAEDSSMPTGTNYIGLYKKMKTRIKFYRSNHNFTYQVYTFKNNNKVFKNKS